MDNELARYGMFAVVKRVNGFDNWIVTGNTFIWKECIKRNKGFFSGQEKGWSMTDKNFRSFLSEVTSTGFKRKTSTEVDNAPKKTKLESIQVLRRKKELWKSRLSGSDGPNLKFMIDYIWQHGVEEKGITMWDPLVSASQTDHTCGLNVLWELFESCEKRLQLTIERFNKHCPGCGHALT
jgi:hypothetical protein